MKKITAYTDGACKGNPGKGAYAVVLSYGKHKKVFAQAFHNTTNNRMEIWAVLHALQVLKEACEVTIFSDSKYVCQAIQEDWIYRWNSHNWKPSPKSKSHIKNSDLWKQVLPLLQKHTVRLEWVKGHAGNAGNEEADQLANLEIEKGIFITDQGFDNPEQNMLGELFEQ